MNLWVLSFNFLSLTHHAPCAAFAPGFYVHPPIPLRPSSRLHYTNQIPDTVDPYAILNLPRGIISHHSIKRAYNELVKKYHPSNPLSQSSTTPEDQERMKMEFQRIHAAYEYLISRKTIDAGAAADGIGRVKFKVGMNGDSVSSSRNSGSSSSSSSSNSRYGTLYDSPQTRKRKHISYEEWDSWDPDENLESESSSTSILKEQAEIRSSLEETHYKMQEIKMEESVEIASNVVPPNAIMMNQTDVIIPPIENNTRQKQDSEILSSSEESDGTIQPIPQPIINTQDPPHGHDEERTTVVLTEFLNKLHTLKTSPKSSSKYINKIHTVNANGTLVPLELGSHVHDIAQDVAQLEQQVLEMEELADDLNALQDLTSLVESHVSPTVVVAEEKDTQPDRVGPKKQQGQKMKVNKALELLSRNAMGYDTKRKVQPKSSPTVSSSKRTFTVVSDGPRLPNSNIRHLKDEFESVKRHLEESKMAIRIELQELEKEKSKFASLEKELEEREHFIREHSHSYTTSVKGQSKREQIVIQSQNTNHESGTDLGGLSTPFSTSTTIESTITKPAIQMLNGKAAEYMVAKELNNKLNRLLREKRKLVSPLNDVISPTPSGSSKPLKNGFSFYPLISNTDTNFKMLFLAHMFAHTLKKSKAASNDPTVSTTLSSDLEKDQSNASTTMDHRSKYSQSTRRLLNLELQKLIIQHMYEHLAQIRLTLKKGTMLLQHAQLPPVVEQSVVDGTSADDLISNTTIEFELNIPKKPILPPKPSSKLRSSATVEPEQSMNILQLLPDTTDPFAILNLKQGEVNLAVIKRAYRQMAKLCHPDKRMYMNSSSKQRQVANEEFAKVNAAYAFLIGKTETYDLPGSSTKDNHRNVQKSKDDFYNFYRKPNHSHEASHTFKKGDFVNIISGPHTDSHGTIMSIYPNMLKVEVNLSMSVFCMLHEVELDKSWKRQREREQRQTMS